MEVEQQLDAAVPAENRVESPRRRRAVGRMKKHHLCLVATALAMLFLLMLSRKTMYVAPEDKVVKKNHTSHSSSSEVPSGPPPSTSVVIGDTPRASPLATPGTHHEATTKVDSSQQTTTKLPSSEVTEYAGLPVTPQPQYPPSMKPVAATLSPISPSSSANSGTLSPPSSFSVPKGRGGHNMTQTESAFVETWCNLNNGHVEWYPTGSNSWQQRAPYVILPGEKHTGTTFLFQALLDHPNFIMATKAEELQFFLPRNFIRYLGSTRSGSDTSSGPPKRTTNVFVARQRMYAQDYATTRLKKESRKVSIDATSGYFFHTSSQLPQHVLCVTPWSQLIIVFRDPVDRVYSQWAHGRKYLRLKQSFEDWIAHELVLMQNVGLIMTSDGQNSQQALSTAQEDEAWEKYQKAVGVSTSLGSASQGALGRSMYVITLRHWITAYKESGKNIADSIHIVRTEDLETNFQQEYDHALQFLHLSPHDLSRRSGNVRPTTTTASNTASGGSSSGGAMHYIPSDLFSKKLGGIKHYDEPPMNTETRQMLKDFFAPYNQRLYQLLEQEFGSSAWRDKHW